MIKFLIDKLIKFFSDLIIGLDFIYSIVLFLSGIYNNKIFNTIIVLLVIYSIITILCYYADKILLLRSMFLYFVSSFIQRLNNLLRSIAYIARNCFSELNYKKYYAAHLKNRFFNVELDSYAATQEYEITFKSHSPLDITSIFLFVYAAQHNECYAVIIGPLKHFMLKNGAEFEIEIKYHLKDRKEFLTFNLKYNFNDEINNYSHYRNYINSIQKMNAIATQYVKNNIKAYNVYAVYFTAHIR